MRILQVNAVYGAKSTGLIVKDIHGALTEAGCESFVLHTGNAAEAHEISMGNRWDRAVHAVLTRLFGIQGLASSASTKRLLKKLRTLSPDVIHLHNIHSNFLNYKLLLNYTAKNHIPVVMTLHDCWFFTGKCYHFLDIGCEKYKTGCHHCPKQKMDIPSLLADNSERIFALRKRLYAANELHVVGCSQWITACAKQSPLWEHAHFYQIYNGVDVSVFQPHEREDHPFTILTMANKWFDPENEAARCVVLHSLAESDRVMVVGCRPEAMDHHDPRVIPIGYVSDRAELARYYAMADVFLNLTYVDTLPTVNMEASACGTPVITYNAGGSGELVDHGKTGYVVEPNDFEALCRALQSVRDGAISRDACRSYAVENFDKERNYRKYIDLYRQCTDRRGSSHAT